MATPVAEGATVLVLDTNIVLDLFVYQDPATLALQQLLERPGTRWLATTAMREELARVLGYPQIAKRLVARAMPAQAVLTEFDRRTTAVSAAPKAPFTCKDADDQGFIDLAVAHRAVLVSKDAHVLCMARRLDRLGVAVLSVWPAGRGRASHPG